MLRGLRRPVRAGAMRRQPQPLMYRPVRAGAVHRQGRALPALELGVRDQEVKAKRVVRTLPSGGRVRLQRARVRPMRGTRRNHVRREPSR